MSTFSSRNTAFLSTLRALEALGRGPSRVREYPSVPEADEPEQTPESFNRQIRRDRAWREELAEADERDFRSFELAMEDECGYHGDRR